MLTSIFEINSLESLRHRSPTAASLCHRQLVSRCHKKQQQQRVCGDRSYHNLMLHQNSSSPLLNVSLMTMMMREMHWSVSQLAPLSACLLVLIFLNMVDMMVLTKKKRTAYSGTVYLSFPQAQEESSKIDASTSDSTTELGLNFFPSFREHWKLACLFDCFFLGFMNEKG
jgi:hypothetical protein